MRLAEWTKINFCKISFSSIFDCWSNKLFMIIQCTDQNMSGRCYQRMAKTVEGNLIDIQLLATQLLGSFCWAQNEKLNILTVRQHFLQLIWPAAQSFLPSILLSILLSLAVLKVALLHECLESLGGIPELWSRQERVFENTDQVVWQELLGLRKQLATFKQNLTKIQRVGKKLGKWKR